MAIGGYGAASLAVQAGVPPLPATLAAMVVSGLCALLLAAVTSRLRGAYLALATLAFGLLVDALTIGLGRVTGGPSGLVGIPDFAVARFAFDTPAAMYFLVLGLIAALVLLLAGGMRSGFGRALQAIRTDQLAAVALGIDVAGHKRAPRSSQSRDGRTRCSTSWVSRAFPMRRRPSCRRGRRSWSRSAAR
jgi:branched-chain amino acid transport system permease protein